MPDGVNTIQFPCVTIGGKQYTLKFDFVAQYTADSMGLDPAAAVAAFAQQGSNLGKLSSLIKLFAAMVAHQYIAADEKPPSADQWAMRISKEPPEVQGKIGSAVVEAILKALPGATTTAPADPATPGAPIN